MKEQITKRRLIIASLILFLLVFTSGIQLAPASAASFGVDSTGDAPDANVGDGVCATGSGSCTLRAAIQEANTSPGADTITVPAGTYSLAAAPLNANLDESGDYDVISGTLTIVGAGLGATILDGGATPPGAPPEQTALDRLFEIHPTAGSVTLSGMTIQGGWSEAEGGAIWNASPSKVTLNDVAVLNSFATDYGGAIYNIGNMELNNATVSGNTTGGQGGGIYSNMGTLTVNGSTFDNNLADSGGAIYDGGELSLTGLPSRVAASDTTFSNNAAATGGAVFIDQEGHLDLTDVAFTHNHAEDYGGGLALVQKSSMTVLHATFSENTAVGNGAGAFTGTERAVAIADSVFSGNESGVPNELGEPGDGGGAGLSTEGSGTVTITNVTIFENRAAGEGGGLYIDNNGAVSVTDSVIRDNFTESGGGGAENAGANVTFARLTITGNEAVLDGGGIESQASGTFILIDSNIYGNVAENGGGFSNNADGALLISRTAIYDNRAAIGLNDDTGLGGGIYVLGDAGITIENTTITGNFAQVRGGGLYVDADAGVRVVSSTISRNSAPAGSGVADEGTNFNFPIVPSTSVIFRNTIVAGNRLGENCNYALGSEGGNIEDGDSCFFRGLRDRVNIPGSRLGLDAIADNGGFAATKALQEESIAVDGGVAPCTPTDARGVIRPINLACDSGAYEHEGPFAPADLTPPETEFVAGPINDTEATSIFIFTGLDDTTATDELLFECRLLEFDPTEPPEPPDPTEPPDPEFAWLGCPNPYQVPAQEEGTFTFEVRAVDLAGNIDPTPAVHNFVIGLDLTPPDTFILEAPPNPSSGRSATFTFGGVDDASPAQFLEFECRIDTNDPEAWLECTNPTVFSNLTTGTHTVEARAADLGDNVDPTPAVHTWVVSPPANCDQANVTLNPSADGWVDQVTPFDNLVLLSELGVRSETPGANARALFQFDIPDDDPGCILESATLRLYASSSTEGRTLEAVPLAGAWAENQVNWLNQPGTTGTAVTTTSGDGYREWDVTSHVIDILEFGVANYGWQIRDAVEEDLEGGSQTFLSKEYPQDPPPVTLPQLVLRFEPGVGGATPPPPPPPPVPATVVCGQVITTSTLVMNDLLDCLGEGLVIGAPNVHLDLNGHTIKSGLPIEPGEEDGLLAGIRNGGHANVIIANGTVVNYGYGVRLLGGAIFNVVENMNLDGSIVAGVELFDADDGRNGNVIRNNFFTASGEASIAIVGGSEGSSVIANTFVGNGGYAVLIQDSTRNHVEGNVIDGHSNNPLIGSDSGIYLVSASDNTLVNNTIFHTGDSGVTVSDGSHRNLVLGNTIFHTSDSGISIADGDENDVINNVAHLAGGAGIALSNAHSGEISGNDVRFNPGGIELGGSSGYLIENNDVTGSLAGGIVVEGGLGNIIRNNTANATRATGIVVEGEAFDELGNPIPGNTVEDNTANSNLGDGIAVSGGGHVITNNAAHNNAGFGIAGSEFNVDGGGNTASGNAEPEQCTHIVCDTSGSVPPIPPDLTAPDTVITAGPADPSDYLKVTFSFTGSDDVAPPTALRFECRLDAPPDPPPPPPDPPDPPEPPEPVDPTNPDSWHECFSPATYEFLEVGEHTFEVRAKDPADNIDFSQASYTWTALDLSSVPEADDSPPRTTIASGPADPTTETSATFVFRGTDNVTPGAHLTYECSLDGASFAPCASPATYTGLGLGAHTFAVRAIDLTANVDLTPATYTWTIEAPPADVTAPETNIDARPDLMTVETSAAFTFSSSEPGSTFECALDTTDFDPCTSPAEYQSLGVGAHDFRVRATDAAGNTDATPAAFSWTVGPPPVPTTVSCGMVLTQSTLVTNNLLDCPADGLVIGADGITVDLNGHTLNGTGLGAGVLNNGFDLVTIANGAILEFEYGVQLNPGTAHNIVSGVSAQLNGLAGLLMSNADDGVNGNIVRHSTFSANGAGIIVTNGTQHALIHNNELGGNQAEGLLLENSNSNRFEYNLIAGSSDAGVSFIGSSNNTVLGNTIASAADAAFVVELASNNNRIEGNTITDSEAGINVYDSDGNEIVGNTATFSGDVGVKLENAHGSLIQNNILRLNSSGITLAASSGNLIQGNDVSQSGSFGIEIGDLALNNVIVLNIANDNDSSGIYVGALAAAGTGNIIDRNTANNNSSDGIKVTATGHIIVGNTANNNIGWGISVAEPTVSGMNIDGGGNIATGNLSGAIDPLTMLMIQCYNISCNGETSTAADLVPPDTALIATPPANTVFTSAEFRFTGSDNATQVQFECRLDSGAFAACTSPATYTGLTLGLHVFEVRAVDWVGNSDPTPATYLWTIEALPAGEPPDTAIDSGPDSTTVNTSATFAFSANEPGATFDCSLDGAPFTTCASPVVYTGLAVGPHMFSVQATDAESLVDPTPASFSWVITTPPVPTTVSCGQTLTQSTLVQNDLLECGGNGLVIGADNITVDLNGHTLDGTGLGVGVLNNGFDSVTILNGLVQEFDYGVQLNAGANGNIVEALTLQLNQEAGIELTDADNNTLRANNLVANSQGIALLAGVNNTLVSDNTISGNSGHGLYLFEAGGNILEENHITTSSEAGIALESASNNVISGNTLSANSGGGIAIGADTLAADNNMVVANVINGNTDGVTIVESNGNQVIGNTIQSNDGGITLELANNSVIKGNDVRFNSGGIELSDSSSNLIESNNASGNSGSGISVEGLSFNNTIVLNTANGNNGEGIYVGAVAGGGQANVIDSNRVNNNSGGGIFAAGGNTVVGNTADFNDGWGIFAESGSTDGGGNFATGNAEPSQCDGVVCTIGVAPGAPDTTIVDKPDTISNSRNALFTFIGTDDTTALADMGFECRLDTTDNLAWVECENPWEYLALSPGDHTFEVRAVDLSGLVDLSPASYTWTYEPLPAGVAPDTFIDLAPPASAPIFEGFFTFSANEPDVTFECALDGGPFEPCEFVYEYAFEEFEVGGHSFQVRATDFEGNTDPTPAEYIWTITGVVTTITDGPAYIPPEEPGEPASGGETDSTTATFVFAANVADATYLCSLDLAQFVPCTSPLTYTGLAVGEHMLRIIAFDDEGNSQVEPTVYEWVVILTADVAPPDTTITGAPAELSSDTIFSFTGTDDQTQPLALEFECRLDSTVETDFFGCFSPFNLLEEFPDFAPGLHTFEVRAIDGAEPDGNIDPTPASYTWNSVADTTPPETAFLAVPPDPTIEIDVEFAFAGSDSTTPLLSLVFECALDGGPFEECDSPASVQGLTSGTHTFEVRAVDLALNADPTPATYTWTVIGPPVTTLTATPPVSTTETTASFEFAADQLDVTFQCSLDGAPFESCTSPQVYTDLGGGVHEFAVQATNSNGLVEEDPLSFSWEVFAPPDTTAPDTTITSGPPAVTLDTLATFTFAASEAGATFECALNGGSWESCSSPHVEDGLAIGDYTLEVRAVDFAGNIDATPATYSWTVDGPPVTTIESGPDEVTDSTSATFTFTANEAVASFDCWLDGVITTCSSPVTYTGLAVGDHVFAVRGTDLNGNTNLEWEDYEWTVVAPPPPDTTAPATAIEQAPATTTTSTSATFAFSANESGSTFECALNGASFTACTSPVALSGLAIGSHQFAVQATDVAGNTDATPAVFAWTITPPPDTTPPETTISSGPAATTSDTSATFSFSASESATFQCSLDGAAFTACTSPLTLSSLSAGSHVFQVRATDAAANVDASPASHSWSISQPVDCGSPVTVFSNADAWIEQNSSSNNKGSDATMKVKAQGSADNFRALVRFPLPNMPAGCLVQSATLRLYSPSYKSGRTIQAIQLNGNWSEMGVTWSNQPATTGPAATTSSGSGYRSWSVATQVQGMYTGGNNGFLIRDATEGGGGYEQEYHAREKGENPPMLIITYGPAPVATIDGGPAVAGVPAVDAPTGMLAALPPLASSLAWLRRDGSPTA